MQYYYSFLDITTMKFLVMTLFCLSQMYFVDCQFGFRRRPSPDIFSIFTSRFCSSPPRISNGRVNYIGPRGFETSLVTYICSRGYSLQGIPLTCENNRWVGRTPQCVRDNPCLARPRPCDINASCRDLFGRASCTCNSRYAGSGRRGQCKRTCRRPFLPRGTNLSPGPNAQGDRYTEFTRVTFSCRPGYKRSDLDTRGRTSSLCFNGFFSGSAIVCLQPVCSDPSGPSNGRASSRPFWRVGLTVTYSCNEGYTLVGERTATCQSSGSFSSARPTCVVTLCDEPMAPSNGNYSPSNRIWSIGDVVTYTCEDGYSLVGVGSATCQSSGSFSTPTPSCAAQCQDPVSPENGQYTPTEREIWTEGNIAQFTCDSGYTLFGESSVTCESSGEYSAGFPTCNETVCDEPIAPNNGSYLPTRDVWRVNDTVEYSCDDGLFPVGETVATCTDNGMFSSPPPICVERCPPPLNISGGTFSPSIGSFGPTFWVEGETANYTCDDGFVLEGDSLVTCTSGEFSPLAPFCTETVCDEPIAPNNGSYLPTRDVWRVNDTVEYSCDDGLFPVGETVATCTDNGTFSSPPPICVERCPPPLNISGGTFSPSIGSFGPTFWVEGETVNYTCDDGFVLEGDSLVTCTSGEFSPLAPFCTEFCTRPFSDETNVEISPVGQTIFLPGDFIMFSCPVDGTILVGQEIAICVGTVFEPASIPTCILE